MQRCVALFHHRWAVPVLAELHRGSGSTFGAMVERLGLPRDTLRQTLEALVEQGLVERNADRGRYRPTYLLTEQGAALAPSCAALVRSLPRVAAGGTALRKWSMPTLFALRERAKRYTELQADLPGVTPRALVRALKDLQAAGLVERQVLPTYPPIPCYRLTARGRALARWSLPAVGLPRDALRPDRAWAGRSLSGIARRRGA